MGLDLHDNTPPNMMRLFENVLYACCKRQSWNIHQLKCQTWDMWLLRSNLSCACSLVLPRCFPPSATCAQVFNWSNSESHQKKRQSCLLLVACYPTYQISTAKPFSILLEIFCSIHPPICRSLVDSANASNEALFSSSLYDSFHLLSISSIRRFLRWNDVPSLSELASWRKAISTLLVCDRNFQADRLWIWD